MSFFRVAKSQLGGRHQRPSPTANSPQPATRGAMALYCGRSCPTEKGLIGRCPIRMWVEQRQHGKLMNFLLWGDARRGGDRWQKQNLLLMVGSTETVTWVLSGMLYHTGEGEFQAKHTEAKIIFCITFHKATLVDCCLHLCTYCPAQCYSWVNSTCRNGTMRAFFDSIMAPFMIRGWKQKENIARHFEFWGSQESVDLMVLQRRKQICFAFIQLHPVCLQAGEKCVLRNVKG